MTMHGAKGLSAQVVFIPALEEEIFPGPWRQPFPGLILEAARLLYVSITRARAACVMSYATKRFFKGNMSDHRASRFALNLGGPFLTRNSGLNDEQVTQIRDACAIL
jgi:superfamily I DNA/RNA helicase